MKRPLVCLLMLCSVVFTFAASESDVILRAQHDAEADGRQCHAWWWSVGGAAVTVLPVIASAFFADPLPLEARRAIALTAPVVGGTTLALVGYFTGRADVPDERIAELRSECDDPHLLSLYESEYRKVMTRIRRRKQGNFAVFGIGASVGAMGIGFLAVYLTK